MLMDSDLTDAQIKRLAANIYRSARAVKDMLQELVDVSRQHSHAAEACRLREVVAEAVDAQFAQAQSQGVEISVAVSDDIELSLERARMERVFLNLIDNALEAMPHGGHLDIEAQRKNGNVLIRVEDSGPGIPDDVRSRLFQPFVSSGKKNGLGLGLALSRKTLLDHGGDLWADPGKGQGARFWVRLPA
jgi:signal transduction histidine kinase